MWWHIDENQILAWFRAISHFTISCSKPESHDKPKLQCILIFFESLCSHRTLDHMINRIFSHFRTTVIANALKFEFRTKSGCTKIWVTYIFWVLNRISRNLKWNALKFVFSCISHNMANLLRWFFALELVSSRTYTEFSCFQNSWNPT